MKTYLYDESKSQKSFKNNRNCTIGKLQKIINRNQKLNDLCVSLFYKILLKQTSQFKNSNLNFAFSHQVKSIKHSNILRMYQKKPLHFAINHNQPHFSERIAKNSGRTPSTWSSINQKMQNYQECISPLNYKVSNPSSSLIMSSLSNIRQDDQNESQTTKNTIPHHNFGLGLKGNSFHKQNKQTGAIHNDFYQYLMEQNSSKNEIHNDTSFDQKFMKSTQNRTFHPSNEINTHNDYMIHQKNTNSNLSSAAQQSLHHLQQSQQELSFLKYKLQQAYEKLQKQILNSYGLQEKIEILSSQLQGQGQLLDLQKKENQKLKFTLKAIMKNKSVLQDQMQKQGKKKTQKQKSNENDRQQELKQTLKFQLLFKEKAKTYQNQIQLLTAENNKFQTQIIELNKKIQKLKTQVTKKDKYLQQLSADLQNLYEIKAQNKMLLIKQTQYLGKINVLQAQIRRVTDQKITSVNRLKHEIALIQKQNGQLFQENQDLSHNSFMITTNNIHSSYSPSSIPKRMTCKSYSKISGNKNHKTAQNITPKTPMIFDSEDEDNRQIRHFQNVQSQDTFNQFALDSLNEQNVNISRNQNNQRGQNKQNISSHNLTQNNIFPSNQPKVTGSVGKWKRPKSSENSSTYFQSVSQQQQSLKQLSKQAQLIGTKMSKNQTQNTSVSSIIQTKLSLTSAKEPQSEDQKLSKYQKHRKNIENQLCSLQKVKRPTPQERQKIQKLQKQLYYIDSDIAGLKRKIRRKY